MNFCACNSHSGGKPTKIVKPNEIKEEEEDAEQKVFINTQHSSNANHKRKGMKQNYKKKFDQVTDDVLHDTLSSLIVAR